MDDTLLTQDQKEALQEIANIGMGQAGAQILDLEGLACHRGSLLGDLPAQPQPSQRGFESSLLQTLEGLDASRPVFVEAESRRIGQLSLPDSLLRAMHGGRCVRTRGEAGRDGHRVRVRRGARLLGRPR